jgi:hypothetical protein
MAVLLPSDTGLVVFGACLTAITLVELRDQHLCVLSITDATTSAFVQAS